MFVRLLMLFTIVPVVELFLLVRIGREIGTMNTIAIVIVTGVVGAAFARSQGTQILNQIREAMNHGQVPAWELVQGAMILVGGVMLVTPGLITDIVGLSLVFPVTRQLYAGMATKYFKNKFSSGNWQYNTYGAPGDPRGAGFGGNSSDTDRSEGDDEDFIEGHAEEIKPPGLSK
jgi:UPF0716 protein FxsA